MTLEAKLEAVRAIIEEHNKAVGEGNPGYVDPDKFFASLKAYGGTSEELCKTLTHEEILENIEGNNKPKLLVKAIAKVLREVPEASDPKSEYRPISGKKADRMTPKELVEAFDPENSDDAVGKRLTTISKGQPFIVFETGRFVDIESTFKLLMEVKQGYPGRPDYTVGDEIKPVYKIGELPDNFADENPLYPNRPLRPDGTCDQTGRSWEGVPLEVRQLLRIATEGKAVSHEKAHDWLDMALEPDAMKNIRKRYREASLEFDELKKTGELPILKIVLGVKGGAGNSPRPFSVEDGKKVVWETFNPSALYGHSTSNPSMAFYKSMTPEQWELWNKQQKRNK